MSKGSSDVADRAQGRASGPVSAAAGPGRAHLILVGLLIALVIAGVAAGPSLHWSASWQGPWHQRGTDVGLTLEVILAALLIALWVRVRRSRASGAGEIEPARRLRSALIPVIIAAMIAVALGIWHAHVSPGRIKPSTPPKFGLPRRLRITPPTGRSAGTGVIPDLRYALLALVLAALFTALVILLRRGLRRLPVAPEVSLEDDDDSAVLQAALRAGRAAMADLTDDRKAIIACYAAMERSLAGAGAAREVAETPDELLARASGAGLLHGEAPETLTALFYQARFSSHEVPGGARTTASRCLDAIEADLGTVSTPARS
jgi:hypothetical protein